MRPTAGHTVGITIPLSVRYPVCVCVSERESLCVCVRDRERQRIRMICIRRDRKSISMGAPLCLSARSYLTQSVVKVVLQKLIPAKIRQLLLGGGSYPGERVGSALRHRVRRAAYRRQYCRHDQSQFPHKFVNLSFNSRTNPSTYSLLLLGGGSGPSERAGSAVRRRVR